MTEGVEKTWAVLVYLAGDNSLSAEMVWALQEMKKASSEPRVQDALDLLVLFDARGAPPRRYAIVTPAGSPSSADDGDLEALAMDSDAYGKHETVHRLVDGFLTRGFLELSRAPHRAVVLSGHGSGAVGDFLSDEDPAGTLSIPMLRKTLDRVGAEVKRKIDVLGMDSCQMSTVEVGFEVREAVRWLVASEGLVLNAGWPYHRVLEALAVEGAKSAESAARAIVERYLAFYRDYEIAGISTDIAATDLSRIGGLADAVRELALAMREPLARLRPDGLEEAMELGELAGKAAEPGGGTARSIREAVVLAHWSAQSYRCDRYVDLGDFCGQLLRYTPSSGTDPWTEPLRASAAKVVDRVRDAVVLSGTTGAEFQHSRGLSIYFPWSPADYLPGYRNLAFAASSKWADFLETYLEATKRMRRFQASHMKSKVLPEAPKGRPAASPVEARVDEGSHRDVDSGTRRGETCPSTMKNPPEGYYDGSRPAGGGDSRPA
jgi:hypothetical protein